MSKSLSLAKVSAKGGFNLFWGVAASSIISSVGIIIIARLLSPSDYGIYSIALIAPNLIKTFRPRHHSTPKYLTGHIIFFNLILNMNCYSGYEFIFHTS